MASSAANANGALLDPLLQALYALMERVERGEPLDKC
jgi:hypothetical protein